MESAQVAVSLRSNRAGAKEPSPAEKLLKYFPVEALALYSALDPAARSIQSSGTTLKVLLWSSLFLSVVFRAIYLRRFWKVERPDQIAISTGALVLYVAALGDPFSPLAGTSLVMQSSPQSWPSRF